MKTSKGTLLPMIKLKGKDYLEVKYRLVWFREDHPDWGIETELVRSTEEATTAKAYVKDEKGRIISMGHKHETKRGFADHAEKAETGAIGRALAMAGYGTQFEPELEEGDRIVDSPVGKRLQQEDGFTSPTWEYRIPFGKHFGKKLEDVPVDILKSYVEWLLENAGASNKPLSDKAEEFIDRVKTYLEVSHG